MYINVCVYMYWDIIYMYLLRSLRPEGRASYASRSTRWDLQLVSKFFRDAFALYFCCYHQSNLYPL